MALTCLNTLVGLSKTAYSCFTDLMPDDFDASDSGYHLTDVDNGLTVAQQCSVAGWGILQDALEQAIREVKTDLRAKLRERFDSRMYPFRGEIGKRTKTAVLSVSPDYIGVRVQIRNQIKGAKFVFKKIYVGLNAVDTVDITVTSNDPGFTEPDPVEITTVANQFASTTVTWELPMWSYTEFEAGDYLEYYISIPRGSAQPVNNTFSCCGSTPAWLQYFRVDGMAADDDNGTGGMFGNQANGFVLDGYLTCEELDWICELEELNGYYLLDVVARAIQMRGAAISISALIDTIQVNPCTGYQFESLNTRRAYLNKRYADYVDWIAQNMPTGVTQCFTCKPEQKFHKNKMLV